MTTTTQTKARNGEWGTCSVCRGTHRIACVKDQTCSTCYRKARPAKVGPCAACGRTAKLPAKGLCGYCAQRLPPGSGAPQYRTREFTAAEIEAARSRLPEFESAYLPAVQRVGASRFRRIRDAWLKEELLAECEALAWRNFIDFCSRPRGLPGPGAFAVMSVRQVKHWQRLTGRVSTKDVLSPRVEYRKSARCLGDCVRYEPDRSDPAAASDVRARWEEFVASLPESPRRLLTHLQNFGAGATAAAFGLTPRELGWRLEALYGMWASAQRAEARA